MPPSKKKRMRNAIELAQEQQGKMSSIRDSLIGKGYAARIKILNEAIADTSSILYQSLGLNRTQSKENPNIEALRKARRELIEQFLVEEITSKGAHIPQVVSQLKSYLDSINEHQNYEKKQWVEHFYSELLIQTVETRSAFLEKKNNEMQTKPALANDPELIDCMNQMMSVTKRANIASKPSQQQYAPGEIPIPPRPNLQRQHTEPTVSPRSLEAERQKPRAMTAPVTLQEKSSAGKIMSMFHSAWKAAKIATQKNPGFQQKANELIQSAEKLSDFYMSHKTEIDQHLQKMNMAAAKLKDPMLTEQQKNAARAEIKDSWKALNEHIGFIHQASAFEAQRKNLLQTYGDAANEVLAGANKYIQITPAKGATSQQALNTSITKLGEQAAAINQQVEQDRVRAVSPMQQRSVASTPRPIVGKK